MMYINATGYYIPEERVLNDYFSEINGLTDEWIVQRTGIKTRCRARADETTNTMAMEALKNALPSLPYDIKEVDLAISATYSPYDLVGTSVHEAQKTYGIENMRAFMISSACSSFVNALEAVEGFFASGKASKALILGGDKNWAYSNQDDPKCGHLWGDAAIAYFISKERVTANDYEILDIHTAALGCVGKGPDGIQLRPRDGGIRLPEGKDVFVQACNYMPKMALLLLEKRGLTFDDLSYFIAHQANMRIIKNIAGAFNLPDEKVLCNIEELGNTGSASCALVFAQNRDRFKKDDLVCMSVFGGGYSAGACLIKC